MMQVGWAEVRELEPTLAALRSLPAPHRAPSPV
jgi:hypothetical protein